MVFGTAEEEFEKEFKKREKEGFRSPLMKRIEKERARKAFMVEQGRRKKEYERRAELSKTRNLLGLRAESALTTPQVDPGVLRRPEDIEAKRVGGGTPIQAVRTPQPTSALTSPVDTSAADVRARKTETSIEAKSIEQKRKRKEAVSAIGSQADERKRLLTSALG